MKRCNLRQGEGDPPESGRVTTRPTRFRAAMEELGMNFVVGLPKTKEAYACIPQSSIGQRRWPTFTSHPERDRRGRRPDLGQRLTGLRGVPDAIYVKRTLD